MFIDAIAGIDDQHPQGARHLVNGCGIAVPQHNAIAVVVDHVGHVLQRFALGDARGAAIGDVDRIATETVPGAVERQTGSCAWFVERVDQDLARQRRVVADVAIRVALVFRGQPEQLQQGFRLERHDRHHVLVDQIEKSFTLFFDGAEKNLRLGTAEHIWS